MKNIIITSVVLLLISASSVSAQVEMTMEEYVIALSEAQKREQVAKESIAEEQARIEELKKQIQDTEKAIKDTKAETYALLGITEEDVIAFNEEADAIKARIDELMMLSPDELAKRMKDIKDIEKAIAELEQRPAAMLFDSIDRINELKSALENLKSNLPDKPMSYTVRLIPGRRDCLWRIAEYDDIYNNPLEWPKIYESNKGQIVEAYERYKRNTADPKYNRAADLIFPGQVFDIPR
ncbi:MAG: hypothetical protein ACLFQK_09540 [Fibrobacterota bacterium]